MLDIVKGVLAEELVRAVSVSLEQIHGCYVWLASP